MPKSFSNMPIFFHVASVFIDLSELEERESRAFARFNSLLLRIKIHFVFLLQYGPQFESLIFFGNPYYYVLVMHTTKDKLVFIKVLKNKPVLYMI